jgi:hypothetical protein
VVLRSCASSCFFLWNQVVEAVSLMDHVNSTTAQVQRCRYQEPCGTMQGALQIVKSGARPGRWHLSMCMEEWCIGCACDCSRSASGLLPPCTIVVVCVWVTHAMILQGLGLYIAAVLLM